MSKLYERHKKGLKRRREQSDVKATVINPCRCKECIEKLDRIEKLLEEHSCFIAYTLGQIAGELEEMKE
jgi:hypothetical protein